MKTHEPIIYDIWDHYQKIKDYMNWLKSERFNLNKSIPASALDYEMILTRVVMNKLEKKMQIEFVGDIMNLQIMQRENFHYITPPTKASYKPDEYELNPSEYVVQTSQYRFQ